MKILSLEEFNFKQFYSIERIKLGKRLSRMPTRLQGKFTHQPQATELMKGSIETGKSLKNKGKVQEEITINLQPGPVSFLGGTVLVR